MERDGERECNPLFCTRYRPVGVKSSDREPDPTVGRHPQLSETGHGCGRNPFRGRFSRKRGSAMMSIAPRSEASIAATASAMAARARGPVTRPYSLMPGSDARSFSSSSRNSSSRNSRNVRRVQERSSNASPIGMPGGSHSWTSAKE